MGREIQGGFEVIFDRYAKEILRYVGFKVADRANAEDIVSSAFMKFWERYATGKKIENPRALLYTIAHGLIVDHYRTTSRRATTSLESTDGIFEIESTEDIVKSLDTRRTHEAILAALSHLKDEYRKIILLHYVQSLSVAECALILGQTENAVRVTMHRALTKLRIILNHE